MEDQPMIDAIYAAWERAKESETRELRFCIMDWDTLHDVRHMQASLFEYPIAGSRRKTVLGCDIAIVEGLGRVLEFRA